jgi:hypothetical protein
MHWRIWRVDAKNNRLHIAKPASIPHQVAKKNKKEIITALTDVNIIDGTVSQSNLTIFVNGNHIFAVGKT